MNIYKMDNKKIGETMREFGKTTYGKITFLLSYSIFLFLIIVCLLLFINGLVQGEIRLMSYVISPLLFVAFVSFVLGSRNYYKELRIYINKR